MPSEDFKTYGLKSIWWSVQAFWRLTCVAIKLKVLGVSWLRERIDYNSGSDFCDKGEMHDKRLLAMHDAVRLAARCHFLTLNCLPKSLVLVDMLVANGHQAIVCIGVAKNEGTLVSHAWVEIRESGVRRILGEPETIPTDFKRI